MIETVNDFFGSSHFNYYCIIVAALILGRVHSRYKFIAWAVFIEFALHKLAYNHLLIDLRSDYNWVIFYIYAAIQLPIICILYKLKCHFFISFWMGVNMLYNLSIPLSFFDSKFIWIYYSKDMFIGTIMMLELIYLGWLCEYVNNSKRRSGNVDYDRIDRLFRVFTRGFGGKMA